MQKAIDSSSPLLLVMCTGNVCRSPMAEALFIRYLNESDLDAQVISRGLAAPVGRQPHPYAQKASLEFGVPLSPDKRAAAVTGAEINQAMAVFIMDAEHRREVQRRYPSASGKTFLLGQWQGTEIADPVNEPYPAFIKSWEQCQEGVLAWLDRLKSAGLVSVKAAA